MIMATRRLNLAPKWYAAASPLVRMTASRLECALLYV